MEVYECPIDTGVKIRQLKQSNLEGVRSRYLESKYDRISRNDDNLMRIKILTANDSSYDSTVCKEHVQSSLEIDTD